MKTKLLCFVIVFSAIFQVSKVYSQPNPGKVIEQMKTFDWMVGDWKGEAWFMGRDQQKNTLTQNEHIEARLGGSIMTIEGTAYDIPGGSEEAQVKFEAFGILTYDLANSKFVMRAYQWGNFVDSDMTGNADGSYSWGMEGDWGKIRYTLWHTAEGKWIEKGEYSRDGGEWSQTFEMTLTKV